MRRNKTEKGDISSDIRRLGVMVEHVDHKVSLVAEQHGDIQRVLGEHTKVLGEHTKVFGEHTRILGEHTKVLGEHTKVLGEHTKSIGGISEVVGKLAVNMEIVKESIEFIKNGFKKKVDADEFSALERRVALLERHR